MCEYLQNLPDEEVVGIKQDNALASALFDDIIEDGWLVVRTGVAHC